MKYHCVNIKFNWGSPSLYFNNKPHENKLRFCILANSCCFSYGKHSIETTVKTSECNWIEKASYSRPFFENHLRGCLLKKTWKLKNSLLHLSRKKRDRKDIA